MFHEISQTQLSACAYDLFMGQRALLTAGRESDAGSMTIGWGTVGAIWNKPVVTVYVRPSRNTFAYCEREDYFSVCFFGSYTDELKYMGRVSGRDEKKIERCGYQLVQGDVAPYFEEAALVLLCRKLYAQDLEQSLFLDKECVEKNYQSGDYHRCYVGEIVKILAK